MRSWAGLVDGGVVEEMGVDDAHQMMADAFKRQEQQGSCSSGNEAVKTKQPGGSAILYVCASSIQPEPVQWLWPNRIPRGKLTILGGDPDQGKTLTALTIAATITRGAEWPDGSVAERGNVVILSAEDDAASSASPSPD